MTMTWFFEKNLRWLGQDEETIQANLISLINSNPIVRKLVDRPLQCYPADIRLWLFKLGYEFVNEKRSRYQNDVEFQQKLLVKLTEWLSKAHFRFVFSSPPETDLHIRIGQFWTPPSYFVCNWERDTDGQPLHMKMHFLEQDFFSSEFYETGKGRSHPAIVAASEDGSIFGMVPVSHKGNGRRCVRFNMLRFGRPEQEVSKACCRFYFKASPSILEQSDHRPTLGIRNKELELVQSVLRADGVRI